MYRFSQVYSEFDFHESSKTHIWTHLRKSGQVCVEICDFKKMQMLTHLGKSRRTELLGVFTSGQKLLWLWLNLMQGGFSFHVECKLPELLSGIPAPPSPSDGPLSRPGFGPIWPFSSLVLPSGQTSWSGGVALPATINNHGIGTTNSGKIENNLNNTST